MDIIIFGTGKGAENVFSFLKKKNRIVFFVDNDSTKWGSIFKGYEVKSPEEIKKYDCDIVVSTGKYKDEIENQLCCMGINKERIYFCQSIMTNGQYIYETYPLVEEKLLASEKALIEFDLNHMNEEMTGNKKVLIFCVFYSVYAKQLIENMSSRYSDIEFSLLTNTTEYKVNIAVKQLKHIYYYQTLTDIKTILEKIPVYDAMQLLWIERPWAYFYRTIRKKTVILNLNVGGSDFYRASKEERDYKRNLISCADQISAETPQTIQEFTDYYGEGVKRDLKLLPFGLEVLKYIDKDADKNSIKKQYHIPLNKIVVTCGHNANSAHQHLKIIDALNSLPSDIQKQIVCVFPMTYPDVFDSYRKKICDNLQNVSFESVVLTEFMDFQAMAEYALISDIMIHVQTTDQLSSTMLEEMYAGSIVIAGSWLPYQSLHEMGIYFLDVDTIPDVTAVLEDVVTNIEGYKKKCVGNKEIVWQHSSWDVLAPKWRALWD